MPIEALGEVVLCTVGAFYTSYEDSGAFWDDGGQTYGWSGKSVDYMDVDDVADPLIRGRVADGLLSPLLRYVANRDDTQYGWIERRDLWQRRFDLESHAWHRFVDMSRQSGTSLDDYMANVDQGLLVLLEEVRKVAVQYNVIRVGPMPDLWRARGANPPEEYRTARELGSPPVEYAGENRMTAAGDSVFYGNTKVSGAVLEVAQDRGGQDLIVWLGQFTPSTEVRYLDVFDIPDDPSPFSRHGLGDADALALLRGFARRVKDPKPDRAASPSHYLPTQVMTAFLRGLPNGERIDAVRFESSIEPGSENWVVFVGPDGCVDGARTGSPLVMGLDERSPQLRNANEFD